MHQQHSRAVAEVRAGRRAWAGRWACLMLPFGLCLAPAASVAQSYAEVQAKALAGDFESQAGLAYGYSTMPYPGQVYDPIAGCAWRIVIVASGHIHPLHVDNQRSYCRRVKPEDLKAARYMAGKFLQQINAP